MRDGSSGRGLIPWQVFCPQKRSFEGALVQKEALSAWVAERAQELRRQLTPHEIQLWQALRAKRFANFKFRRQVPIGRFIADFVCFQVRLVVELDGGQHSDQAAHDQQRDLWLQQQGFVVLRFWNNDWDHRREAVLASIWAALHDGGANECGTERVKVPLSPGPSPARGEG